MDNETKIFDEEYIKGAQPTAFLEKSRPKDELEGAQIEAQRYGLSKPTRIVIRGKIAADEDQEDF
jgi:hypothetical protein